MSRPLPYVSRRALLTSAAVVGAGAVGGAVGWQIGASGGGGSPAAGSSETPATVPTAGSTDLVTGRRPFLRLIAFDVVTTDPATLAAVFDRWTASVRDLNATVRVGYGASLFDDRLGLSARKPPALTTLSDVGVDAATSGGDLLVHLTADSENVASAAFDAIVGTVAGALRPRWSRSGHTGPQDAQSQVRNPLGFVDGTGNPAISSDEFRRATRVTAPTPDWLAGGTYLCYRRVRIDITRWSTVTTADQQVVIGRRKDTGAPLSGGAPTSDVDLTAVDSAGELAIPQDSHVRLTAPAANGGATMFRNSYDYDDGLTRTGARDIGLLFMAFVADPPSQFEPVLRRMLGSDRLNEFTTHTSTGVWAFPAPDAAIGAGVL